MEGSATWYLGAHTAKLFDRNGNAGPTVWADGRIVGGWAQRADGEVVFELLEDVGRETTTSIGDAAAELAQRLGAVRVKPRFPTPLQKQLRPEAQSSQGSKSPSNSSFPFVTRP